MHDISYRVALGGIVAALCLVTMFLAGIIPPLYIILPMAAGILMMIIAVEVSSKWALLTYIAVSLLSMIITFDKEAALLFIMFFGHYPILRLHIERIRATAIRRLLKLTLFNLCIILFYFITVYFFGLDQMIEEFNDIGRYGEYIMLALANILFVLYDTNLRNFYIIYRKRLMPKFKNKR